MGFLFVGCCVDLDMRRYIVLFLITGIMWAQTGLDKLVMKDGTEYLGEYSRVEKKIVYFKPLDAFAFQPVPIKKIYTLQLKDGRELINIGKFTIHLHSEQYSSGIITIEEKAIYDAAGDAKKWLFYPLLTGLTFVSSIYGTLIITREEPWESLLFMIGTSTVSLAVPYFGLNNLDKNQIAKISPEEIELYENIYFNEFKKRKSKNIVMGSGLLGLTAAAGYFYFLTTFSLDGDFYFGP